MNVLIATDIPLASPSASRNRLLHVAAALKQTGFQPIICAAGGHDQTEIAVTQWEGFTAVCYAEYSDGSLFTGSPAMKKAHLAARFYRRNASRIFVRFGIRVCIARFNTSTPVEELLPIAKRHAIPITCDLVECYSPSVRMVLNGVWFEQTRFLRKVFPRLDGVIGISKFWLELAEKHGLPSIWLPPFAIPSEMQRAPDGEIRPEIFTILFIGHWVERECPITLLDSLALTVQAGYDVRLRVLGKVGQSRWEQKALRHLAKLESVRGKVEFLGYVGNAVRDRMMAQASAFVLLRAENQETRALFPTRLPEYLLSGNPVILSQAGEFPACFTHRQNVWFVPAKNSAREISDAIIALMKDESLRRQIGAEGRKRAEELFSRDVLAPRLASFLELLVNNRQTASSASAAELP